MSSKNGKFDEALKEMRPALEVAFGHGRAVGREEGRKQGRSEGFQAGRVVGYVEGVNALKPAVSDGLRHGSPACGAAMRGLKNLGLHKDDDKG